MKICPLCQKSTKVASTIEIKCNGHVIYGIELCPTCRDTFLNTVPLYEPRVEDVLPQDMNLAPIAHKVVTKEELLEILQGTGNLLEEPNLGPCPSCGQTTGDDQMGCPECYEHFDELIQEFVTNFQAAEKHVGKVPKNYQSNESKVKELKLKLAYAKEHENFILAAELLNQLKKLDK